MKRIILIINLLICSYFLYSQLFIENELLIQINDKSILNKLEYNCYELFEENYLSIKEKYEISKLKKAYPLAPKDSYRQNKYTIQFQKGNLNEVYEDLKNIKTIEVEKIELERVHECTPIFPLPDDYSTSQNLMEFLDAACAWNISDGDSDIKIAIIDELPAYRHRDLNNKVDLYRDVSGMGVAYHGIPVAGDAAAETDNDFGISSIGYKCHLYLYNAASSSAGYISSVDATYSIDLAVNDGVDVINMSFGSTSFNNDRNDAVQEALDNGIVVVASAGAYNGTPQITYPCGYNGVICVSAVDLNNDHPSDQNRNTRIDICAPDRGFYSLKPIDDIYVTPGGTSHSAPIVAGIAGLMKAYNESLSPFTIRDIIKRTGRSVDNGYLYPGLLGGGTVQPYCALYQASSPLNLTGTLSGDYERYYVNISNASITSGSTSIKSAEVNISGTFEANTGTTLSIFNPDSFSCPD